MKNNKLFTWFCILLLIACCFVPIKAQAPANPTVIIWVEDYTDSSGTDHPEAAVIPASINIDEIDQTVGFVDYVYASPSAIRSVFLGKSLTPIGQHSYTITKEQFPVVASGPVTNGTVSSAVFGVTAQFSTQTLDTASINTDGTPKLDTDGKPVMESWVAHAVMKRLDLVTGGLTAYP